MSCLETQKCWKCAKETVVPRVSPCSENDKLTGMWLITIGNDYGGKNIGVLCKECAFKLCDENKVMLGFCGGLIGNLDNWEAVLLQKESKT